MCLFIIIINFLTQESQRLTSSPSFQLSDVQVHFSFCELAPLHDDVVKHTENQSAKPAPVPPHLDRTEPDPDAQEELGGKKMKTDMEDEERRALLAHTCGGRP